MNIRDMKPSQIKRLAAECEEEFSEREITSNGWRQFGTQEPMTPLDIWRLAFSRGASAILRRTDSLKD